MTKLPVLLGLIGYLASAAITGAAELPQVSHLPSKCVPKKANAKIGVQITGQVISARVYFHAEAKGGDYYVEMRRGRGDQYWTVLPLVDENTGAVFYRIAAKDSNGKEATTAVLPVLVSGLCPVAPLSEEERRCASNLVVGQTAADQAGFPAGFLCEGIVGQIAASGELWLNVKCPVPGRAVLSADLSLGSLIVLYNRAPSLDNPISSARPTATSGKPTGPRFFDFSFRAKLK